MLGRFTLTFLVLFFLGFQSGCRTVAPIYVWKPPQTANRPIRVVALAPLEGSPEMARAIETAMTNARPTHQGAVAYLDPVRLGESSQLQLISFDGRSSDLGAMNAARLAQADVLLQGNIIHDSVALQGTPVAEGQDKGEETKETLSIVWQVLDVQTGQRLAQESVIVDRKGAEKAYPDLQWVAGANNHPVVIAAARQSWQLVAPTIQKSEATLVRPWLSLGASQIRKGNKYAEAGKWDLAEQEWQEAVHDYHFSKAAWYNLSMAAVAREDFELAKRRLDHSYSWLKFAPTDAGLVWMERQQQAYHKSFGLPPPLEGWRVPEIPTSVSAADVKATPPQNIDNLPWWTAIPFTKPPGWTWSSWLRQPLVIF